MIKQIIIQLTVSFLSYIIPKKGNSIVLGSGNKFQGNPKYFFLYLSTKKTCFDAYWSAESKKLND